jgi:hypothetical protein
MTATRADRTAALTAAAKAKSQAKTTAAEKAIRTTVKRGEPVAFQASAGRPASLCAPSSNKPTARISTCAANSLGAACTDFADTRDRW